MNSLNILSARIGQTPPSSPLLRQRSSSEGDLTKENTDRRPKRSVSQHYTKADADSIIAEKEAQAKDVNRADNNASAEPTKSKEDEKTPLLEGFRPLPSSDLKRNKIRLVARRLVNVLAQSLKWVMSALTTPGVYVVSCFYDDKGNFSPFLPIRKLGRSLPKRKGTTVTTQAVGISGSPDRRDQKVIPEVGHHILRRKSTIKSSRRKLQAKESFSSATSESDLEQGEGAALGNGRSRHGVKSETESSVEGNGLAKPSIRIKSYNEDAARRRKEKITQANPTTDGDLARSQNNEPPSLTLATIKSPTSPSSSSLRMTNYSRALAPPRPLIPRRQPSYSTQPLFPRSSSGLSQKTLVIDLDETLIHSLAKGGRMSSGHMVEVKLNTTSFGGTLGPQHPILYYVHKRPHCDEFLRKVCKWYNLVVFTASVQEYADPVIDWLELERKYFSGRYYRQHCTYRKGAYIKDLSSVEPDLSKVMILDNSPLSYIFHEGMEINLLMRRNYSDISYS